MENNQYDYETYFSFEMVKEIMKEFEWPVPYELIDSGEVVEAVILKFPKCEIELSDDGEGSNSIDFRSFNNGIELNVDLPELIIENYIENYNPSEDLELEYEKDPFPNTEDTKKNVRNGIKVLQHYFMPFITGEDYSWANRYIENRNTD